MSSSTQIRDANGHLVDPSNPLYVSNGANPAGTVTTLLDAVTVTGAGSAVQPKAQAMAFSARGNTSAGAGAATIAIQASNSGLANTWFTIGTITLTLSTTTTADGFGCLVPYAYIQANCTSLSGTNATVTAMMGV